MAGISERHIFIVDDEPTVCEAIGKTLEKPSTKVSCFVHAGECLEQLRSQQCDLLIADLRMPEMNGIELMRRARHIAPWLPVLIITGYGDLPTAVRAMQAGAVDFVEKPLVKANFVRKVKSILQQGTSTDAYVGKPLSRSEMRILKSVMEGKSNTEIAHLLRRSKRTVESHRANIMHKLCVNNLVDLAKRVLEMGLTDLETQQEPGQATRNSEDHP